MSIQYSDRLIDDDVMEVFHCSLSFIMHEAEVTNSVYTELKREMKVLQDELSKSRENTVERRTGKRSEDTFQEKVEKERDNAKKEAEDYVFMMELQKKKMMGDKSDLSRRVREREEMDRG